MVIFRLSVHLECRCTFVGLGWRLLAACVGRLVELAVGCQLRVTGNFRTTGIVVLKTKSFQVFPVALA